MDYFDQLLTGTTPQGGDTQPTKNAPSMQVYSYSDQIKPPNEIGVSSNGNMTTLKNDIKGIQSYVSVLTTGDSKAQTVSPLGNKYFMDMGTECKDTTGKTQARFAFINNIPDGKFLGQKGLVPGILEDLAAIDPTAIFSAFQADSACQQITLQTRDTENKTADESRYVSKADIKNYNACWFPDKTNPVSNETCQEGMQSQFPKDPLLQTYYLGLGAIAGYMLYRLTQKH